MSLKSVFTPMLDKVLVEPEQFSDTNEYDVVTPENIKRYPTKGTVIEKGPLVKTAELGDTAIFPEGTGVSVTIEGKEFLVMRESEIFGTITTTVDAQ